jgi:pilus assembly protein TadC
VVAALAVFALLGGPAGVAAAVVVAVWVPRWLVGLEPRAARRRREAREAELALVVDLLAACLAAGAAPAAALQAVAGASTSTVGEDLSTGARALRAGATPSEAFRTLPADLAILARVFDRSSRTGASVAHLLATSAEQLRADERAARLDRARRLGVKAAAPLGLCFLPGFVVLGLVPVVIGLVTSLV